MKGHIRQRGPSAWELKFDVQSDTGERKTRYVTFHGGKRDAQKKLTELLGQVNKGSFIDPSKTTLAEVPGPVGRMGRDAGLGKNAGALQGPADPPCPAAPRRPGDPEAAHGRFRRTLRQAAIAEAGGRRVGGAHGRACPSPDAPHHGACGEMEHCRRQSGDRG